jgi:5-methylthioadenosine/S-adenosylhomocysteine deaminase
MVKPILISNCTLLASSRAELRENCYIRLEDSRIRDIGNMRTCPDENSFHVIDGSNKLVLPGLVNSHCHSGMTLFRGLADDLELGSWLYDHIFPAEKKHVSAEMVYWCTKLGAAEMIMSGTTCVADGYFFSGMAAAALHDSGMRGIVAHGILDFPTPSVPDPRTSIESVRAFIDNWKNRSSRITPALFAHSPYTCSNQTLRSAKAVTDQYGVRFFIHVAESEGELDMIVDPQGPTPIAHLASLGILDENCTCVHAIWLDDSDLDTLARSGASVITCPQSNLKLAAGIARVPELHQFSIPIGLGTDGAASNNSLDMFREMNMLGAIHQASRLASPTFCARDILSYATSTGARSIGLSSPSELQHGAAADLILVDIAQPHLTPFSNPSQVVSSVCGSDVTSVIIDGSLVMHDRKILSFDLEEVYENVQRLSRDLTAG